MGDLLPLLLSVALAAAVQTVSGFGFSLIMMPLAVLLLGLPTAAPLVALIGLVVSLVNAVRNRKAVDTRELRVLALVAIVGVPVGVWLLSSVNEDVVKAGLGILLIAYASFSLLRPNVGRPIGPQWGYPAGFIAGCLAGAYNVPGPALVLYGSLRRWPPDTFRGILQSLFVVTYTFTAATHALTRHIDNDILRLFALSVPAFVLGVGVGSWLDRWLDPSRARQVVNVSMIALGLSLLRTAWPS